MPDYVGIPPLDVCEQLLRLREENTKKSNVYLNVQLLFLHSQGYRVDQLAFVLGVHQNAIYARLRSARRVGTDNPPVGSPDYVSPNRRARENNEAVIGAEDIEELKRLYRIANKRPGAVRTAENFQAWTEWSEARYELARLLTEAIDKGVKPKWVGYSISASPQYVVNQIRYYRSISQG